MRADTIEVELGSGAVLRVDGADYRRLDLGRRRLRVRDKGHGARRVELALLGRWVRLDRLVAGVEDFCRLRYLDGDPLNLQRANLIPARGSVSQRRGRWYLSVRIRGRLYNCGDWPSRQWAEEVRDLPALGAAVAQARRQGPGAWDRRRVREAIDRAIGRIRRRHRVEPGPTFHDECDDPRAGTREG